jgi:CRP-like cAMP-binding protein
MTTQPSDSRTNFEGITQTTCTSSAQAESQDPKIRCLIHTPLFAGLSGEQYREVASVSRVCLYSENEEVFVQDDPGGRVLVVAAGAVKITGVNEAGYETLLGFERAEDCLDDTIGPSRSHSVCARRTEDGVLLASDATSFEALSVRIPTIERNLICLLRNRLQAHQDRFCDVSALPAPQRLARNSPVGSPYRKRGLAVERRDRADDRHVDVHCESLTFELGRVRDRELGTQERFHRGPRSPAATGAGRLGDRSCR